MTYNIAEAIVVGIDAFRESRLDAFFHVAADRAAVVVDAMMMEVCHEFPHVLGHKGACGIGAG